MKAKIQISILAVLFALAQASAQEIDLIITKGSAQIGTIKLGKGRRFDISRKDKVKLAPESKAILIGFDRRIEIETSREEQTWTVQKLSANLKRQPAKTNFYGYILKSCQKFDEDSYTAGTQAAGVEGLDNKRSDVRRTAAGDVFSPVDSARLLGNSVKIEWQLKKALVQPKLVVYDLGTKGKVLEQDVGQQGEFTWQVPSEGLYKWEINSPAERRPVIGGIFIRASAAEQARLLAELEAFQSDISDLSTDTQHELLSDYKRNNKIVTP